MTKLELVELYNLLIKFGNHLGEDKLPYSYYSFTESIAKIMEENIPQ